MSGEGDGSVLVDDGLLMAAPANGAAAEHQEFGAAQRPAPPLRPRSGGRASRPGTGGRDGKAQRRNLSTESHRRPAPAPWVEPRAR